MADLWRGPLGVRNRVFVVPDAVVNNIGWFAGGQRGIFRICCPRPRVKFRNNRSACCLSPDPVT
jgi:hypothetical protein